MSVVPEGQPPELFIEGHVAVVTLRRPQVANRLERVDLETIRGYLRQINAIPEVLVLRLQAQGRHFCSGFNIESFDEGNVGEAFEALTNEMEEARPVTIAVINGGIYGGATDLALACDFRLGVPGCEMFVPAARLGLLFYKGGLHRYVSRLGLNMAKKVLLMGAKLNAQQMRECGFLDDLHAPEALIEEAEKLSATMSDMAPLALLGMKKHLNRIAAGAFDNDDFKADIARADASSDLREGALAWREKRKPVFTGQ
jgi:enoyl-CoA hydratase